MSPNYSVAIALPCFNEADGLERTFRELNLELIKTGSTYQFFVQDDFSTDDSVRVLESLSRSDGIRISVERNETNCGHGTTSLRAYRRALASGADYVVFLDSDGQFTPSEITGLVEHCINNPQVDICHGVRVHRVDGLIRKCVSTSLRLLIRIRFGVRTRDPNSPMRVFRRSALSLLLGVVPSETVIPNVWLSILAAQNKRETYYRTVEHRHRSGTTAVGSTWRSSGTLFANSQLRLLRLCFRAGREIVTA